MESGGARSVLAHLITNFNLDNEEDHRAYEHTAKALKTQEFIEKVTGLMDERNQSPEPLVTLTREELEERYRQVTRKYAETTIEAAEFKTLLLTLDYKFSKTAEFIEDAFARFIPYPESIRTAFDVVGVTPNHRIFRLPAKEERKTLHLKLVK